MRREKESFYKKIYTEDFWYLNTYESLGSQWLIDSIEALHPKRNFRFANLSANAAYYEEDAYNYFKDKFNPFFYLGDIYANEIKKKASHDRFVYLDSQRDACEVTTEMLDNMKIDIILDCKGALWHAMEPSNIYLEKTISVLEAYESILSSDGILLIDYYDGGYWDVLRYRVSGGNRRRKILKCFGEYSTKKRLRYIFGRDYLNSHLQTISTQILKKYPLSKTMGTAAITKNSIKQMIEVLRIKKK